MASCHYWQQAPDDKTHGLKPLLTGCKNTRRSTTRRESPKNIPNRGGEAIHFYHLSVRGEVSSRLDLPGTWRTDIVRELAARQAIDGSYQNKMSPLMKEDDRLLATTLAVQALKHVAR